MAKHGTGYTAINIILYINMAPYTEIIKRHHTAVLKQAMGYMATHYKRDK